MRLRLLTMSLVGRVLSALNLQTTQNRVVEDDARRTALLGDEASISEQTARTRAFAEEVSGRISG